MCYRIYAHVMFHDVRPLITYKGAIGNDTLMNPYARPRSCCQQDESIRPWFRCEFGHGCCYLMPRVVKCTKAANSTIECHDAVPYHTYDPARKVFESDGPDSVAASEEEGWCPFPILHEPIGWRQNSDMVLPPHEESVEELDQSIAGLEGPLQDLMLEFREIGVKYRELKHKRRCDSHHICRLIDWECPENQLQQDIKETKSRLIRLNDKLTVLDTKFTIRRMAVEAITHGFVGECSIDSFIK
ncbi:hypothetical protein VMCG_03237 [Cytospora schulzeri]|uniref:Uncharacterized protein n=1 Tax=Cytospora schulzeri TaxID=448051 RepID=A0A423WYC5_9PEZI|nr:hypothetical protein VMCG_03237 [Valsa malicola]